MIKRKHVIYLIFFALCIVLETRAEDTASTNSSQPQVTIYAKRIFKLPIALAHFIKSGEPKTEDDTAFELRSILRQDLDFTNYFTWIPPEAFLENPNEVQKLNFKTWATLKTSYLISGHYSEESDKITVTLSLYDIKKEELSETFSKSSSTSKKRQLMHFLANQILQKITGEKGIFLTKIAFVSDRSGPKELYMMDYDGHNIVKLTSRKNIVLLPAWSPDGSKILYSSYATHDGNQQNLDLFSLDLKTKNTKLISSRKGLNMGGTFSPDGRSIAATLSLNKGNPNIYQMNEDGTHPKPIIQSYESDFSPTYSPDGKKLLFVSTRKGNPHLFIQDLVQTHAEPKRLTFAGHYNAAPKWSGASNRIVFAGELDGHFDLFDIDPKGFLINRLTKILNQGDNEHPSWSPNGRHIVFYSTRERKSNIYVITADGSLEKKLTDNFGHCSTPAWSSVNFTDDL